MENKDFKVSFKIEGYEKLAEGFSYLGKTAIAVTSAINEFEKALQKMQEAEIYFKMERRKRKKEKWIAFGNRIKRIFHL